MKNAVTSMKIDLNKNTLAFIKLQQSSCLSINCDVFYQKEFKMKPDDAKGKHRVTLADIAKEIGVSKMTVSLALRKHSKISEKTRIRVQQKAEEMGYIPDPMLSALNQYRANSKETNIQATLAWINPYHDPRRLRAMREFNLYWEGASAAANQMGFNLEAFATTEMSFSRMNTVFKTRNIQGILLAALCRPQFSDQNADFTEMPWEDYAIVRFGRSTAYPEAHYVTSAQTTNTVLAFEQIRKKGYERIGFVTEYRPMRTFSGGVTIAQQVFPEEQRLPILSFTLGESMESRIHRLKQWIIAEKPDAIFTDEEQMPEFMKALDIRIPKDIALVTTSIHDTPINAGIDQNPKEVGRTAIRTLISLINEQSFGIPDVRNEILVEGRWVDGSMLPECI